MKCKCGSKDIAIKGKNENTRKCKNCGKSWYVNNCWNCSKGIDSRSDGAVKCSICSWYKCPSCGKCMEDCSGGEEDYYVRNSASNDGDITVGKSINFEKTTIDKNEEELYDIGKNDKRKRSKKELDADVLKQGLVEGSVIRVGDEYVFIDIGANADGVVPRDEFGAGDIHPGDTVEVYREGEEEYDGQPVLSKERADEIRSRKRIREVYSNDEVVKGEISRHIKGGLIVELFDGIEAFLPASEVDVGPVQDIESYLGEQMVLKIVKHNPENENIVVSHRETRDHEYEGPQSTSLDFNDLEEGQVVSGTVDNLVDFGAFIDLGGFNGLLHISEISHARLSNPNEELSIGQEVRVLVQDIDSDKGEISLSRKKLKPDPWEKFTSDYKEGEVVEGEIVSIENYGAFVEVEPGVEGLLHISELPQTRRTDHPSQVLSKAESVTALILDIDEQERELSLSMKKLEPDPWDGFSDDYSAGMVLSGEVCNLENFGAFVEIQPGIEGLVHISDLSWTKRIRHPGEVVEEGEEIDFVILDLDEDRQRVSLGHKQVRPNPWEKYKNAYREGTDTEGEVVRVRDDGLTVELPLGVEAFVPKGELKHSRNFENRYDKGETLALRVLDFNKEDIILSEPG